MLKIQIDTAIWEDEWFAELNAEQKLFWLYLISNPLINIAGYFKITMRSLIFVTGLSRNKITEIINLFEAEGKVRYIDNYMLVVNFSKYQCYNPSTKLSASRLLNSLPDKVKHTLSTRCRHGVDTVNNNSNNNNNNINNNNIKSNNHSKKETLDWNTIKSLWNKISELSKAIPRIELITDKRKSKVISRTKNGFDFIDKFDEIYHIISNSSFLKGEKNSWKITFDWLFANDSNWVKLLEGNYNGNEEEQQALF